MLTPANGGVAHNLHLRVTHFSDDIDADLLDSKLLDNFLPSPAGALLHAPTHFRIADTAGQSLSCHFLEVSRNICCRIVGHVAIIWKGPDRFKAVRQRSQRDLRRRRELSVPLP